MLNNHCCALLRFAGFTLTLPVCKDKVLFYKAQSFEEKNFNMESN